jgi:hypothetical protein
LVISSSLPKRFSIALIVLALRLFILSERNDQNRVNKYQSNKRWIVGRKINVSISGELEITEYQDDAANVYDNTFDKYYEKRDDLIYLTDQGYRKQKKKSGTPANFKICKKGTWNDERM